MSSMTCRRPQDVEGRSVAAPNLVQARLRLRLVAVEPFGGGLHDAWAGMHDSEPVQWWSKTAARGKGVERGGLDSVAAVGAQER
jgi:hypothetical protein